MRPLIPVLLCVLPLAALAPAASALVEDLWVVNCEESGEPHEPSTPGETCFGVYTLLDDGKVCHFEKTGSSRHDTCYKVIP